MSKQTRFLLSVLIASIGLFAGIFQTPSSLSQSELFSAQPQGPLCLRSESFSDLVNELGAVARSSGRAFDSAPQRARQKPAETTSTARNAALVAATLTVLKETSEIRQLPILRPVHSSTQSRAEIERMIVKNLDEETTPADLHADEVTLRKLGLVPMDFQYRPFLIKLLTEQVAGYYDPKVREFHLADWIDLDGQKPIMAHELTHALQDQHFNLRRFEHWPKGDSDAELAAHSLIEGDATLTMMLYVANDPMRALAFLKSLGATGMASAELEKAPRALRDTLLFPYQEGTDWTRNLYKAGGWARVSGAFTDLPQSTEQVLHPDKYFAHEAPVKVSLPDITALLNASEVSAASGRWAVGSGQWAVDSAQKSVSSEQWAVGSYSSLMTHDSSLRTISSFILHPSSFGGAAWRRIDYDVNGEWGFYLILEQFLKSPGESRRAAAGWGGDRFEVYEGPKGEALIASLSTWDTERDAREFFDAYVKRTQLRYPGAEIVDTRAAEGQTYNSKLETRNSKLIFRTSEGAVAIELRGTRVLIVEGVPDHADLKALLAGLWR